MSLFLAVFALDAFDGRPFFSALPGFLIHLLPAFLVLAAVAVGWRFPIAGALAFGGLAVIYAISVKWRPDWIALIGGPLLIIAALFVVSARHRVVR
jgi:hypothetical protein